MSAWPGGPCPECGQDIPANVIHCQFCRALLNPDLYRSDVEIPAFFELKELESVSDAEIIGLHVLCPHCEKELRINRKYTGQAVACKYCNGQFRLDLHDRRVKLKAYYADCPHCEKELRLAPKYVGARVSCKFCNGHVQIVDRIQGAAR